MIIFNKRKPELIDVYIILDNEDNIIDVRMDPEDYNDHDHTIIPIECNKMINLENVRRCDVCGKPMYAGYCTVYGYYCSDECLLSVMTWDDYLELYDNGNGDSYYTEWESLYY